MQQLSVLYLVPRGVAEDWEGEAESQRFEESFADLEVCPECGSDYGDDVEVLIAWNGGSAFRINDVERPDDGISFTREELRSYGIKQVLCRFDGGTRQILLSTHEA